MALIYLGMTWYRMSRTSKVLRQGDPPVADSPPGRAQGGMNRISGCHGNFSFLGPQHMAGVPKTPGPAARGWLLPSDMWVGASASLSAGPPPSATAPAAQRSLQCASHIPAPQTDAGGEPAWPHGNPSPLPPEGLDAAHRSQTAAGQRPRRRLLLGHLKRDAQPALRRQACLARPTSLPRTRESCVLTWDLEAANGVASARLAPLCSTGNLAGWRQRKITNLKATNPKQPQG